MQGGDSQDQNLLQFLLNVQEFGMTPQEAAEAANFNSYQMKASFDQHDITAGPHPAECRDAAVGRHATCMRRGYTPEFEPRTSGPINAIMIDPEHGTFWGGSSNHGEDYGIAGEPPSDPGLRG